MKVLISVALLGIILSEGCNAILPCSIADATSYSQSFATCGDLDCLADLCGCCTQALAAGDSDSNYECCSGYAGLLECVPDTPGLVPCPGLPDVDSGASTVTAVCVVSGVTILVSSVINQFLL